jgi:amidase
VPRGDKQITWQLDATALSALLDAREITPLQLLEQSLSRLDALEPVLNALTHVDREGALAAAKAATARQSAGARLGPLDGIPVSVKDNIFVAGLPARWGSLLFREHIPDRDDICVERLRASGAVIGVRVARVWAGERAVQQPHVAHGSGKGADDLEVDRRGRKPEPARNPSRRGPHPHETGVGGREPCATAHVSADREGCYPDGNRC